MQFDAPLIKLLAMTARLHDLYVLGGSPSECSQAFAPQDRRRNNRNGQWLEVGATILYFLFVRDELSPESFVPLDEISEQVSQEFPVSREGVLTALKHLHTPCRMTFEAFRPSSVFEQTALVEQAVAGSGFRISMPGRDLFYQLNRPSRLEYTPEFVSMMEKDLADGKLPQFLENCESLIQMIRDHSLKVTKIRERNAVYQKYRAEILESSDRHLELLKELRERLLEISNQLRSPAVAQMVEEYSPWSANDPDEISLFELVSALKKVHAANGSLIRNLTLLFQSFHDAKGSGVARFSIQRVVDHFWEGKLTVLDIRRAQSRHGIWSPRHICCSLYDVPRKLRQQALPERDVVLDKPESTTVGDVFYQLLSQKVDDVRKALAVGPVRLSEMVDAGSLCLEDISASVGVCFNSGILCGGDVGEKIIVKKAEGSKLSIALGRGRVLSSDDVQLEIAEEK